jgi:hypothetical protein
MPNEFWAAILGAFVGGLVSCGLQWLAFKEAANRRREELVERNRALAHSILFKMIRIHSNLHHLTMNLRLAQVEGQKAGLNQPWQYLRPLANWPDTVHWTPEEMSLLLSLREDDLFNSIVSLDIVHNSTLELFKTHREMHAEVAALLPGEVNEGVAQSELSPEQARVIAPKIAGLNMLGESMIQRCETDYAEAAKVLADLNRVLSEKLGLKYKIEDKQP